MFDWTYAVVAMFVELSFVGGVGAVGVPVNTGLAFGAYVDDADDVVRQFDKLDMGAQVDDADDVVKQFDKLDKGAYVDDADAVVRQFDKLDDILLSCVCTVEPTMSDKKLNLGIKLNPVV